MVFLLAVPVWYAVEGIFWPTAWVRTDAWIDGRRVEKIQVSLQSAEWIQRVEVAAPGVVLVLLGAVPGYVLVRILIVGEFAGVAFADQVIDAIERAKRWVSVASVAFVVSWVVCAWMLGRDLGARVSPPSEALAIVIMLVAAAHVYSSLAPVGRRMCDEIDEVV